MISESQFQGDCMDYLDARSIYYIKTHGGGWTGKGTPDLVVCVNGKFIAFELKVNKNGLQPDQIIHKKRIERSKGKFYSPKTLASFIEIIESENRYER